MFINIDSDNKVTGKSSIKIGDGIEISDNITVNIGDTYNADGTITPDASAPIKAQIADIDAEIAAIEANTFRPLREIQLGIDDGTAAALLADYQTQIVALREQRAALVAQLPGGTL